MTRTILSFLGTCACAAMLLVAAPDVASASGVAAPAPLLVVAPALEGKLNVNKASETQWELLPGIGPATARKLVSYARKRPFAETIQVMRVKGIGRKTYNRIKPYLTVKGPTTLKTTGKAAGR